MPKTKLIGITGCTNSGKSTLCKHLNNELPNSICIFQDDFYHERNEKNLQYLPEADSFNFDVITAIDMEKFKSELIALKNSEKYEYILIDGFLIFEDKDLSEMLDKKYFILLDKEESRRRRESRQYNSKDTPNYFDKCVWVEYLKYFEMCKVTFSDITFLDGTMSPPDLVKVIVTDFEKKKIM